MVTSYFNPTLSAYVAVAPGTAFYKTLFDNDGLYSDGLLKQGWTGSGIQTYTSGYGALSPTLATTNDPITGSPGRRSYRVADGLHVPERESDPSGDLRLGDGTFIQYDSYIENDKGQVATASDFSAATTGTSFTQQLLKFNFEQVITASEFGGRTIDLVSNT